MNGLGQGIRGRFLVNLVREDKENISNNNIPSHNEEPQNIHTPIIHPAHQLPEKKQTNYYISPIHSGESDIDDSDADPNFDPFEQTRPFKVVPSTSSGLSKKTVPFTVVSMYL